MKISDQSYTRHQHNVFEEYFYRASLKQQPVDTATPPYISISREMGCRANIIANKLSEAINRKLIYGKASRSWSWINKNILIEASRALELDPAKIEYVFQSKKKSTMDEIVGAMATRYYKNDKKIRSTITRVIRSIAKNGRIIIVGRGGVAFAKDNPQSLHIKLTAPFEWRVSRISSAYKKSKEEAREYVKQIDQERQYLIDSFMGYPTNLSIFDLILNRATMTEDEIVSIILNIMQERKLIV